MRPEDRLRRIDDAIDAWHRYPAESRELHEFLGWTWDEYKAFTERLELPPEREGSQ